MARNRPVVDVQWGRHSRRRIPSVLHVSCGVWEASLGRFDGPRPGVSDKHMDVCPQAGV